jgi:O-antigen ligase
MQVATLEEIFTHSGFICIFLSILITVANILIGVSILPEDKRKRGYRLHRVVYLAVVVSYVMFLWVTHSLAGNGWMNYAVLIYFIFVIPMTRKVNVTTHAVLSSLGLVLLVGVGAFGVF